MKIPAASKKSHIGLLSSRAQNITPPLSGVIRARYHDSESEPFCVRPEIVIY